MQFSDPRTTTQKSRPHIEPRDANVADGVLAAELWKISTSQVWWNSGEFSWLTHHPGSWESLLLVIYMPSNLFVVSLQFGGFFAVWSSYTLFWTNQTNPWPYIWQTPGMLMIPWHHDVTFDIFRSLHFSQDQAVVWDKCEVSPMTMMTIYVIYVRVWNETFFCVKNLSLPCSKSVHLCCRSLWIEWSATTKWARFLIGDASKYPLGISMDIHFGPFLEVMRTPINKSWF